LLVVSYNNNKTGSTESSDKKNQVAPLHPQVKMLLVSK